MPAVVSIGAKRGEYAVLQFAARGLVHNIGVLLLDPERDRMFCRLRRHWDDIADPEDAELLELLDSDLRLVAGEMGAGAFLGWLEDKLSNSLRITDREVVEVDAFTRVLDRLFGEHVEKLPAEPFRTHLPLWSVRAAATRFGEEQEVEEEDWVRAPEGLRLREGMFAAHVVGRSMEPRIPDGSLNVFRAPVVGSRQGKILLIELAGDFEGTGRYTIKRYTSTKRHSESGAWEHETIRLEPLNPEFQAFELEPDQIKQVIAEWICTLE